MPLPVVTIFSMGLLHDLGDLGRVNEHRLALFDIAVGGKVRQGNVIVEQKALLDGRTVLNARHALIGGKVVHRLLQVLIILAAIGVGTRRDRDLDGVKGVLPLVRGDERWLTRPIGVGPATTIVPCIEIMARQRRGFGAGLSSDYVRPVGIPLQTHGPICGTIEPLLSRVGYHGRGN